MSMRGWSTLEIKSVDAEKRIITGIASTPSPDRQGDIMLPEGAKFSLPMPLLWQHRDPIGEVFDAKVTSKGIEIQARIAQIDEAGLLKERLDLAWQSIKAKLVKGLSIGWRPLKETYDKVSGNFIYPEWEWFELSAVTIPANGDCSIRSIKAYDVGLAATGTEADGASKQTGVSVASRVKTRTDRSMKTSFSQKIKDFEAERAAKTARMDELLSKEEGLTLDAAEKEEHDTLQGEVKAIDEDLVRLRAAEERNKAAAVEVRGKTADDAAASRTTQVRLGKINRDPGIGMARAVMCKMAAFIERQKGEFVSALEVAKQRFPSDSELFEYLGKASVAGGTTTDSTWAAPLAYPALAQDFIDYLRPKTIIGKFGTTVNGVTYPALRALPFNVKVNRETAIPSGYWVGEGKPVPVSKSTFDAITMAYTKVGALSVITRELARFSSPSAEAYVRDALTKSAVARIDTDLIDPAKAVSSGVNPASLTNGVTTVGASAGTSADNARTDLIKLLAAFQIAQFDPANLVLIMPNTLCMALSILTTSLGTKQFPTMQITGGYLEGIPVIGSQYAANLDTYGNMVIAIDASSVGLADDGTVEVDISTEASLQMLDNPTNDTSTPTATTMVSLWQTNSIGIKVERFINWQKLRTGAVQWYDDINWGSVGSPG